jgi:hypothetical protein
MHTQRLLIVRKILFFQICDSQSIELCGFFFAQDAHESASSAPVFMPLHVLLPLLVSVVQNIFEIALRLFSMVLLIEYRHKLAVVLRDVLRQRCVQHCYYMNRVVCCCGFAREREK